MSLPKWFKYPPFTTSGLTFPFSRKQAERFEGTSNNIPLLDLDGVPSAGAATAYGLRRLRAAYTGAALKVRRTIGVTTVEADVHFNGDDKVGMDSKITIKSGSSDATTLGAFCKDIDGFVALWYDQSGNARDLGQTTAAAQPYLVVSGVLQAPEDGLYFDGSARWMKSSFEHESSTDDYTYLCVSRFHASVASGASLGLMTDIKTYDQGVEVNAISDVYRHHIDATDLVTTATVRSNKTDLVIASFDANPVSNQQKLRVNGVLSVQTCTENIQASQREVFGIGVRRHDAGGYAVGGYWHGYISEVITWETALDEDEATAVTDDITDFFSIELLPESDRFSLLFDGTDDHITTSADSTLASKSYSFWAKSTEAGRNAVFDHGGEKKGSLYFNHASNKPLLYAGTDYYRYWVDNAAQDDGNWHHWVCYIEHDDITNSKLYCDGVLLGASYTATSGSADAYSTGIRGGRVAGDYFDGSLDEFAIFDGELTSDQINSLRNNNGPADLTPLSPEHWWKMDEGSGTNVIDYGSGGNDGTISSAPEYTINCPPQFSSTSVEFDGTDDYVNIDSICSAFSSADAYSFSCWFKTDGTAAGWNNDILFSMNGDNNNIVRIGVDRTNDGIFYADDGTANETIGSTDYNDEAWHHLVITRAAGVGGQTLTAYVDGASVGTESDSNPAFDNAAHASIGQEYDGAGGSTSDFFAGKIDEVAVWNRALSRFEVAAIYNSAGTPRTLDTYNPTAWWRMGEGSPTGIILDEEGTGDRALYLPGVASNYASVPDAADLDGFTNFTLEAKGVTFADWTTLSTSQGLMSKYKTSPAQRSWLFRVNTDGKLYLVLSFDGTATTTYTSSEATGVTDGATADLMVMRTGEDIRFYVDGVQLGTDQTCVTTALHNSTDVVAIGAASNTTGNPMTGSMERARIWDSAVANQATPTETPVLDMNFTLANKGVTSFTATSGQTVTIHSTAGAAVIKGPTDGSLISGAVTSTDTP